MSRDKAHFLGHAETEAAPLFSDPGDEASLPEPLRDYPPVHYLKPFYKG